MATGRPGKPLFEDAVWISILERYVAGETGEALAQEFGTSVSALNWQARNRGYRKMDRPGAVYRWRQAPPITPAPEPEEARGFGFDPDDLEGSQARALEKAAEAAREGRLPDFLALTQSARAVGRLRRSVSVVGSRCDPPPPHPSAADGGVHPPHEGEGEDGASPAITLRPSQIAPAGDWRTWLFLGGRGAGKTLAGASWLAEMAERCGRLALVGPTLHDVREVMIGGPSGVMALDRWRGGARPAYAPSRRRLVFPNGAEAHVFSAEDPDSLRGPQFAAAWADEYAAWGAGAEETLAMLRLGLRLPLRGVANARAAGARCLSDEGDGACGAGHPRLCVTTTPRPTAAMRRLRGEAGLVETRSATVENAAFLAPGFLEGLDALYGGTRRAAQELEGKVVEAEGALFTAEMMERARGDNALPPPCGEGGREADGWGGGAAYTPRRRLTRSVRETTARVAADPHPSSPCGLSHPPHKGEGEAGVSLPFERVVVAVDPTATAGGCACGIVVVGRRGDVAWVLDDRSAAGLSPQGWAGRAVRAADDWGAQAIVAETNQGGDMVEAVLRAAGAGARYQPVRAQVGKRARAEPVAALYEQGRVKHARRFEALEEELMALGEGGANDRADALVWAVTELMLGRRGAGPRLRTVGEAPPLRGCWHDSLWTSPYRVRA